ncbi:family 16 glycosylhydrolase [Caldithrix abyssi]
MKRLILAILAPLILWAQKPYRGAEYRTLETFTYGRFEVRMKSAPVSGMLSSFFTYHEINSIDEWNEIDIEILGRYNDQIQFNTITAGVTNHVYYQDVPFNPHQDFHLYAMEWTPNYVAWYVDSVEVFRQTGDHISTLFRAQKLMMNIWPPASESWAGTLNENQLPAYAYYDLVRVYRFTPGENQDFTLLWQDDFNAFDTSRWQKATHSWDGNNSQFIEENAVLKDGYLILCLTMPTSTGYQGGAIHDEDVTAPYIARAWFLDDRIVLNFSESIKQQAAETASNYIIPGLTVKNARLLNDERTVVLEVSERDPQVIYHVIATNISDRSAAANRIKVESIAINNGVTLPLVINLGSEQGSATYQADYVFNVDRPYGHEGGSKVIHPLSANFRGAQNDTLYRSELRGLNFYRVRLPDGPYRLTFFFAESEFNAAGQRRFDVFAEGQKIIEGLDIFERVGNFAAYVVTIDNVEVKDQQLDLYFKPLAGKATCSALKIEKSASDLHEKTNEPRIPRQSALRVFPNPANPRLQLEFELPHSGETELSFYDVSGKRVLVLKRGTLNGGIYRSSLDVSGWGSGLYVCVLKQEQRMVARQKFIVLK